MKKSNIEIIEVKYLGASSKWKEDPPEYFNHITANKRHKVEVVENGAVALATCIECGISWEIEIGG